VNPLRRFAALAPADRRLVLAAAAWFTLLRIALRIVPLSRLLHWCEQRHRHHAIAARPDPERIAWATRTVARRLAPPASCLPQALTAQVLLGGAGRASTLRFGARLDHASSFGAHAWLECDGRWIVGEEQAGAFQELRPASPPRQ